MEDEFIFDNKPSLWQRLKKSWLGILIVACLSAMLGALTIPDYVAKTSECQKWGLGLASPFDNTCMSKFRDIVFVIGDTQNTPAPTLNHGFKQYLINSLMDDDSRISVISVSNSSRNPYEIISKSEVEADAEGGYEETSDNIENYINNMTATNNGADYLEAIRSAAEYVEDKSNTLIYVIGSGLSDKGLLNFADDELLAKTDEQHEAKKIAEKVYSTIQKSTNSMEKELKNINIIWDNIGQVVAPQPEIDKDSLKKVKDIYRKTFEKLGAKNIIFKNSNTLNNSAPTTNTVKITKSSAPTIIYDETFNEANTETFQFKGDSAEFINYLDTENEAKKIMNIAKANPNSVVYIESFMSKGKGNCSKTNLTNYDKNLLSSRLDAVKSILSGVNEDRIVMKVGGFGEVNECPNGIYDEAQAKNNRIVRIAIQG